MEQNKVYQVLTKNKLQIIAAVFMFLDHFVTVFLPFNSMLSLLLRLCGRTAAPVFCFFIAQGFHYTSNLKKYALKLLALALISHLPYNLSFNYSFFQASSIILPLFMGLIALAVITHERFNLLKNENLNRILNAIIKISITGFCCAICIRANWNFIAVLWIIGFGLFHGNFKGQIASFTIIGLIHIILSERRYGFFHEIYPQWFQLGIFLAIPLLALYNNKQGKKSIFMSWFFYVFYPAHLLLLYFLKNHSPLMEFFRKIF